MVGDASQNRAAGFGLQRKFLLLTAGPALVLTLLILVVSQGYLRAGIDEETMDFGASLADTLASSVSATPDSGSRDALAPLMRAIEKNPSIDYADVTAADGAVLASTAGREMPRLFSQPGATPRSGATENSKTGRLYLYVAPIPIARPGLRAGGASHVRLAVNDHWTRRSRRRARNIGWMIVGSGLLAAAVAAAVARRLLIDPILRFAGTAEEISRGDLTRRSAIGSGDELGSLSSSFDGIASRLEQTLGRVSQSQKNLAAMLQNVSATSAQASSGVDEQRRMLDEAYESIEELDRAIRKIIENVDGLSKSSEETSSSMLEMAASMEEVSRHTDSLFSSVEQTGAATHQMVTSINEVDRNVDHLETYLVETSTSMSQMNASITQVEANAARSYDLALGVAEAAEAGMRAVGETVEGMEQIRRSVFESNAVMLRLGERSSEIGKILTVIDDIADQTNLLALNAAILAAQAGEHGRGFSVVAAQIRELSERTASSTREIGALINSVREEVDNASAAMSHGSKMADRGVSLSQEAGKALNRILDSSAKASDMGRQIASATREQALGSEAVGVAIGRLRDMVTQINTATSEQAKGSKHILGAVESMREVTRYVRQATIEHKSGSVMISDAADHIIEKVHEIFALASSQGAESERLVDAIEQIRKVAESNGSSGTELAGLIQSLGEGIRRLDDEVQQFRRR